MSGKMWDVAPSWVSVVLHSGVKRFRRDVVREPWRLRLARWCAQTLGHSLWVDVQPVTDASRQAIVEAYDRCLVELRQLKAKHGYDFDEHKWHVDTIEEMRKSRPCAWENQPGMCSLE